MASEKVALRKLELDHELKLKRLDVLSKALDALTPTVTAIGLAIFGIYLPSKVLAGHITFASIGINVLGDLSIAQSASYLFGIAGIAYGIRAQRLRGSVTVRLAERERALELRLDPNRTSSGLTPRGTTPKGDS
jgi:hypothetical protein